MGICAAGMICVGVSVAVVVSVGVFVKVFVGKGVGVLVRGIGVDEARLAWGAVGEAAGAAEFWQAASKRHELARMPFITASRVLRRKIMQ